MNNRCEQCELPKLIKERDILKMSIQAANANISASESPTQAEPYQEFAKE